jgi:hypothetical protein
LDWERGFARRVHYRINVQHGERRDTVAQQIDEIDRTPGRKRAQRLTLGGDSKVSIRIDANGER